MIHVKTAEEIALMRESARIVSKTLGMLASELKPGVTGLYLDGLAETFIRDHGASPGFLGMYDFPNTLNISPNAQVVHGIPTKEPFREGDIVSIDCGALKNGFYGDHAYTFEVGEVATDTRRLLEVTKESLYIGIREFRLGKRVGDVGYAIQKYCEDHGYGVVRELVGQGLGRKLHEAPEMPNYGKRGRGKRFVEGMVVAIEPMINMGGAAITITVLTLAATHTLGISVDLPTALLLSVVAALSACGASGVAGGSLLLIPLSCSLFGISNDIAMQVVAVGFVISVLQDSAETALNSSTDVVFTAAVAAKS